MPNQPRTAIVHYWLVGMRGGERVLERLITLFPDADVYTHVYVPDAVSETIRARTVKTTFINGLPGARTHYQKYLPLMPLALEQLDLREYDLVIASESGPAKGVILAPGATQLCYVHSPMRYLWDHYHDYRASAGTATRLLMAPLFHYLRGWDTTSAARVDHFVANSTFIRQRIAKSWRRPAEVVHPPVPVGDFAISEEITPRYLWVGQMVAYKRPDIVVEAFNRLGLPLLMVGDGDMYAQISKRAGSNIEVIPRLRFAELKHAYATCRALVFAAEEDFGIVPVEANASGRPVLAYGRGGIRDSIIPGETGMFFDQQSADSLIEGVQALETWLPHFSPCDAVRNARRFAPERFDAGMRSVLAEAGLC